MLTNKELLQKGKNLLAFSAGGDSTALFHILLEHNIPFDIAIVNYQTRPESQAEFEYAQELAKRHSLQCHVHIAPKIVKNFEANARAVRYDFFEALIKKYDYDNLLTAHHLADRFEWMLMQFCKGAGCLELIGMQSIEKRENYTLLRPLLQQDKEELLSYLKEHNIHYFDDASNQDEKYKRNRFRHKHTNPLLQEYREGIRKSFTYIDEDAQELAEEVIVEEFKELASFKTPSTIRATIYAIDKFLKKKQHLMSAPEKKLLQSQNSLVIGRKFAVSIGEKYTLITPYTQGNGFTKSFKEKMRLLKIDPKHRGYFFEDAEAVAFVSCLLA